jgi:uncharacterized protein YcbK (DUF882 family)
MHEFIAPYILLEEYWCQSDHSLPPDLKKNSDGDWPQIYEALFSRFAMLREAWGKPIPITSGYRTPDREQQVSGSRLGPHILGLSLDLGICVEEQPKFCHMIDMVCPEVRVGVNTHPGSVHVHYDVAYLAYPRWSSSFVENCRWVE